MKRRILLVLALLILGTMMLAGCAASDAPKIDWTFEVKGAVETPLTLSYKDLAARERMALDDVLMRKSQGEDTTNDWEGPSVQALLNEAGASASATTVVATASDGYAREMDIADMHNAIIALKMDGAYVSADAKGVMRIVVPDQPANHWLFQLVSLEVK